MWAAVALRSSSAGTVERAVGSRPARFVTVDVALSEEGATRVVEVGDGQVSDLPQKAD
jgi:hypothetical protein